MAATAMNLKPADRDSQLAMELAMQLAPINDILDRHGLTVADLRFKLSNPLFRRVYQDTKRVWESDLGAEERIRIKAMMLVEDSLLQVYSILHSHDTAPQARIDAFKQLSKVAGVDQSGKGGDAAGTKVSITFNIEPDKPPVMLEAVAQAIPDGVEESED